MPDSISNSTDYVTQNLTNILEHLHALKEHFGQFKYLSSTDVAQLKAIVDQLEYFLSTSAVDHHLATYLQDTLIHLKNILRHEQPSFSHSLTQQQQNNDLSQKLLERIKKISPHH